MNKNVIGLVVLFGMVAALAADVVVKNLVADPGFQHTSFESPRFYPRTPDGKPVPTTWVRHQINLPSEVNLNKDAKSVTMKGGKSLLHSSRFPVKAGQSYTVSLKVQGKGKVSIETLWWQKGHRLADGEGLPVPHRTVAVKPVTLDDETKVISGVDTPSPKANEAYIRIVVEDGTVTVSEPSVTQMKESPSDSPARRPSPAGSNPSAAKGATR